jgi:WD40 repeat protein
MRLEEVSVIQFSTDGNYMATACGFGIEYPAGCYLDDDPQYDANGDGIREFDGTVRIWKKSGQTFDIFRELATEDDRVYGLAFDPKSQFIGTAGGDKRAGVWSIKTGKLVFPYKEHSSWVWSIAFNPDSDFVVTTDSTAGRAHVWDAHSGKDLLVLRGHQNFVGNAVFSPDGRFVLTLGNDGTARIWELNFGQIGKQAAPIAVNDTPEVSVIKKIRQQSKASWNKAVSSQDRRLVVTFNDQELSRVTPQVWLAETGGLIRSLESPDKDRYKDGILAASFSQDNQYLALAEYGNVVRVWRINTGDEIALIGHEHFVHHIAFSPRAECVATASDDEDTLRLWRTTTGDSLAVMPRRVGDISIAFDSSGRYLMSQQGNDLVRFYSTMGCAATEDIRNLAKGYLEKSTRQH